MLNEMRTEPQHRGCAQNLDTRRVGAQDTMIRRGGLASTGGPQVNCRHSGCKDPRNRCLARLLTRQRRSAEESWPWAEGKAITQGAEYGPREDVIEEDASLLVDVIFKCR
jgi:hypothetical protein